LAKIGVPTAEAFLVGRRAAADVIALADLAQALEMRGWRFPLIVKPVRGRGSEGVRRVQDLADATVYVATALADGHFGSALMVEEFLEGDELTLTVMPPGSRDRSGNLATAPWALRPVRRVAHQDGVAPYNGAVAVTQNSIALTARECDTPALAALIAHCVAVAQRVGARAPIRIDCRAGRDGYRVFDLNMKPNMTGPGRPGREDQDSLSALAARAEGWRYEDLLEAMLQAAWPLSTGLNQGRAGPAG